MVERKDPVLVVEGLEKRFGRTEALRGVSFALDRPGVYGFLGPNGAGKTTTFKCISALLRPTAGRIRIAGVDVQSDTRLAVAPLGVQFDSPAFYPHLSGSENLRVIAKLTDAGCERRIPELLDLVGLADAGRKKVGQYSWGMKQRLGIASALICDPRLLLMDEPTNGLDPAGIADIRRLLPRLAEERGMAILLSSHRMTEVEHTCFRVIIIHRGEIVADGSPRELAGDAPAIEIRCSDPARALELLRGREDGTTPALTADGALLLRDCRSAAGEINGFLVAHGIRVDRMGETRESLEQAFFRLTGTRSCDE